MAPSIRSDSFWIRVNSGPWQVWSDFAVGSGWFWEDANRPTAVREPLTVALNAGRQTIEVAHRAGGALLDRLLITDVTTDGAGRYRRLTRSPRFRPPPRASRRCPSRLSEAVPSVVVENGVSLLFKAAPAGYLARLTPLLAPQAPVRGKEPELDMTVSAMQTG